MVSRRGLLAVVALLSLASAVHAMEPGVVPAEYAALVPQRLLPILHTPQVQQELGFDGDRLAALETLLVEVDGPWFRARNLPVEKQRETIGQLETRVHVWFNEHATDEQRRRLTQLEIQAQGVRALLRKDVAQALNLKPDQQQELAESARETEKAQTQLADAQRRGEATEDLEAAARQQVQKEEAAVAEVVTSEQLQRVGKLIGERFDTRQLRRIYPLAPEFAPVDQWLNSEPLTMRELRGKVVLVHFYAFQCHNCHANFDVYRRWHEELADQGVVVVGIQTPETTRERDPAAVKAAAKERDLKFPIVIDLESANWQAYGNTMWPTVYVVDKNGYLRHWWQGELRWQGATGDQAIETLVAELLKE